MNLIAYDGQIELEEDDWFDEEEDDFDDDEDEWECEFGANCLVPHFVHRRSECYDMEMALAWQEEQERDASAT